MQLMGIEARLKRFMRLKRRLAADVKLLDELCRTNEGCTRNLLTECERCVIHALQRKIHAELGRREAI